MRNFYKLALSLVPLLIIFLLVICQCNQTIFAFIIIKASLNNWYDFFSSKALSVISYLTRSGESAVGRLGAQIAIGSVFGVQIGQNSSLSLKLKTIGMSHLWSASGLSLYLFIQVINSFLSLFSYVSFNKKTFLSILSLLFFWCVGPKSASLQRSFLSILLFLLFSKYFGFQLSKLRLLVYILIIIILLQPTLINSLSLWFSVGAVFGVICLNSFLSSLFKMDQTTFFSNSSFLSKILFRIKKMLRVFFKNVVLFLSLQLGMLPLISLTWGEISLMSLLLNILMAGVAPNVFYLGLIWCVWIVFYILWLRSFAFAKVLSSLLMFPLEWLFEISDQFVQIDQMALRIPEFSTIATIAWYTAIFLINQFFVYRRKTEISAQYTLNNIFSFW